MGERKVQNTESSQQKGHDIMRSKIFMRKKDKSPVENDESIVVETPAFNARRRSSILNDFIGMNNTESLEKVLIKVISFLHPSESIQIASLNRIWRNFMMSPKMEGNIWKMYVLKYFPFTSLSPCLYQLKDKSIQSSWKEVFRIEMMMASMSTKVKYQIIPLSVEEIVSPKANGFNISMLVLIPRTSNFVLQYEETGCHLYRPIHLRQRLLDVVFTQKNTSSSLYRRMFPFGNTRGARFLSTSSRKMKSRKKKRMRSLNYCHTITLIDNSLIFEGAKERTRYFFFRKIKVSNEPEFKKNGWSFQIETSYESIDVIVATFESAEAWIKAIQQMKGSFGARSKRLVSDKVQATRLQQRTTQTGNIEAKRKYHGLYCRLKKNIPFNIQKLGTFSTYPRKALNPIDVAVTSSDKTIPSRGSFSDKVLSYLAQRPSAMVRSMGLYSKEMLSQKFGAGSTDFCSSYSKESSSTDADASQEPAQEEERQTSTIKRRSFISQRLSYSWRFSFLLQKTPSASVSKAIRIAVQHWLADSNQFEGQVSQRLLSTMSSTDSTGTLLSPALCIGYMQNIRDCIDNLLGYILLYRKDELLANQNIARDVEEISDLSSSIRESIEETIFGSLKTQLKRWCNVIMVGMNGERINYSTFASKIATCSHLSASSAEFGLMDPKSVASSSQIKKAIRQLGRMGSVISPVGKMFLLLDTIRSLIEYSSSRSVIPLVRAPRNNQDGVEDSTQLDDGSRYSCCGDADDLFPLFIYCVCKSKLQQPWVHLTWLRYLSSSDDGGAIRGEKAYYLTMFEASLEYIHSL